jgi:hypothetical protein
VGVEGVHPGQDDAIVDQAAQVVLGVKDLLHCELIERIPVRQDVMQGQEHVGAAPFE